MSQMLTPGTPLGTSTELVPGGLLEQVDAITPDNEAIADHIRSRTRDKYDIEVGTFNADTRPTGEQAQRAATNAARYVALRLRAAHCTEWSDVLIDDATDAVAVYAALQIEESYYSDGATPDDTGVDQLGRMARERIDALLGICQDGGRGRGIRSVRLRSDHEFDPLTDGYLR